MESRIRARVWIAAPMIAGAFARVVAARAGRLTPDDCTVRARDALTDPGFVEIDGESMHFVDPGRGPAFVLVHGSFAGPRMWNDRACRAPVRRGEPAASWNCALSPHRLTNSASSAGDPHGKPNGGIRSDRE